MVNETLSFSSIVDAQSTGTRLDLWLAKRFTYLSRNAWQEEIGKGSITVNHRTVTRSSVVLKTDDVITFNIIDHQEPPVDTGYSILYQDKQLIIINKPANLPVHPAGKYQKNTLQSLLEEDLNMSLYPLHRIDRETSGCIAFATSGTHASKALEFYPSWKKQYLALVKGQCTRKLHVTLPLGPDTNSKIRKKRSAYPGAEETAETWLKPLQQLSGSTFIEARPVTGRLHQIRVHCAASGFPILGDKMYGENEELYLEYIQGKDVDDGSGMKRTALHAHTLSIIHPVTKKTLRITAPLPQDMQHFIETHTSPGEQT